MTSVNYNKLVEWTITNSIITIKNEGI